MAMALVESRICFVDDDWFVRESQNYIDAGHVSNNCPAFL